ncbi:MAG: aminopeptidase [Verrucomicrobiales bacterium]|nr:aminopeptidase [Verrucomicrobiales bacterium]
MTDPRIQKLAKQLVTHSTSLKKGEHVLIDAFDVPSEMPVALIRAARDVGAFPHVQLHDSLVTRELGVAAEDARLDVLSKNALHQMKSMDAYIAIRGSHNINEMADVEPNVMKAIMKKARRVLNYRVNETRWCVLRWPTSSMAQQAGMSTAAFEDFYFKVCLLDYKKLLPAMRALKKRMEAADEVHITGPGTDLKFSIKNIPAIACGGEYNIPDGEVFTAPIKNSINGTLSYNAPSIYQGTSFDQVKFRFEKGKIIEATANNTEKLNEILDSDSGARFIGEFAIGFNREIKHPMRDILFDEKIGGSFHFTPGQCYEQASNGNKSQIHWDLVCIQRSDYGGGEIAFDGEVIRRNGKFLAKDLKPLN